MGCPSEVEINKYIVFSVCTHNSISGASLNAVALPEYKVYEDETVSPIVNGAMAFLDGAANTIGFYTELLNCNADLGFESNKTYTSYIQANVASVIGSISYNWRVVNYYSNIIANTSLIPIVNRGAYAANAIGHLVNIAAYTANTGVYAVNAQMGSVNTVTHLTNIGAYASNAIGHVVNTGTYQVNAQMGSVNTVVHLANIGAFAANSIGHLVNVVVYPINTRVATANIGAYQSNTGAYLAADGLSVTNLAEHTAVPVANASLNDKISWIYMLTRNRITQDSIDQRLLDNTGATNVAQANVSDDGTTAIRGKWS